MKQDFQQLIEMADERGKLQASWYRQILTLATGGLALLVALHPAVPPEGIARYLLALSWLFLGLGIVFGAGATYSEVDLAKRRTKAFAKEIQKSLRAGKPYLDITPIVTKGSKFYKFCKYVMLTSLLLAVVCLVGFSILKTLTPKELQPTALNAGDEVKVQVENDPMNFRK